MWLTFGGTSNRIVLAIMVISFQKMTSCIANSDFNANLRDYSVKEDINETHVRTLQKEDYARHAGFTPMNPPVEYKEVPDNAISSTSYKIKLGVSHHEPPGDPEGYVLQGYEEHPQYSQTEHGSYKHLSYGPDLDHHEERPVYEHQDYGVAHHYGGREHYGHGGYGHIGHNSHIGHNGHIGNHYYGHGYGHHHKHFDHHALTAKAILLPVAGLAILGAAAALVSNPLLLQLGVVSGRRKRDTNEVLSNESYDQDFDNVGRWTSKYDAKEDKVVKRIHSGLKRKPVDVEYKKSLLRVPAKILKQSSIETVTLDAHRYRDRILEDSFVPVPLKLRPADE